MSSDVDKSEAGREGANGGGGGGGGRGGLATKAEEEEDEAVEDVAVGTTTCLCSRSTPIVFFRTATTRLTKRVVRKRRTVSALVNDATKEEVEEGVKTIFDEMMSWHTCFVIRSCEMWDGWWRGERGREEDMSVGGGGGWLVVE